MKRQLSALTLLASLLTPLAAQADKADFHRASVPPNYLLQPGDQLEIQIDSLPETEKIYQVRADGSINHPVAGEIMASGKSLKQVADIVKTRLAFSLKKPSFRMGIYSVAEIEASTVGEVKTQGKFNIHAGGSLLELLALSGGPTVKADTETAVVIRDGKEIPVSLSPGTTKELSKFKLVNGDTLMVNPGKRVSVTGEVREPGVFAVSYKSEDPIEDALRSAGGTKETAALNHVVLSRPSERKPFIIDINQRDEKGHIKLPTDIRDGDIITVQPNRCVVVGAVDKQGPVVLSGNETLFDIVSASGTSRGRLDEVCVIRAADVEAGSDKRETYNLEEAFNDHKAIPKVSIYDGDVVFVPAADPNTGGIWNAAGPLMNMVWMARSMFAF